MAKRAEDRYQTAIGLWTDLMKCLEQLEQYGEVREFEIGGADRSSQFRMPEKLYGRQGCRQELFGILDTVCQTPGCRLVMIDGPAGVGKSSLALELYQQVIVREGRFVSGRFSEADRNVPYASLIQAFRDLARQLLTSGGEKLEEWKRTIAVRLGNNARIIADVVPELALLVGDLPEVQELPSIESQNRFNHTFLEFVRAVTSTDSPLVIFLDDLHRADPGSLKLLEFMATDPEVGRLLIVGSYRDNEVGEWHPLAETLERVKRGGHPVPVVSLEPLDVPTIVRLLADLLGAGGEEAEELARVCHRKTNGNPFFLNQFLHSLHERDALRFDAASAAWKWRIGDIETMDITDNVVELMCAKIGRLSKEAQELLRVASCIGRSFNAPTIAHLSGQPAEAVFGWVQEAVQHGLVMASGDAAPVAYSGTWQGTTVIPRDYRFVHDRIREAAYSTLSEDQARRRHLEIARVLAGNLSPEDEDLLFQAVDQCNRAGTLLSDPDERLGAARLNLAAGVGSRKSLAVRTALGYVERGLQYLPRGSWQQHYEMTCALHSLGAECAQLDGNESEMNRFGEQILVHCRSAADRARVYETRVGFLQARRRLSEGVDTALEGFALLGVKLPRKPKMLHILTAFLKLKLNLRNHPPEALRTLPAMNDGTAGAVMRLIKAASQCAYFSETSLIPLFAFKMVELTVKEGVHPLSAWGVCGYGFILAGPFGKVDEGLSYARAGQAMLGRFESTEVAPHAQFLFYMFCSHWEAPLRQGLEPAARAHATALENGDPVGVTAARHLHAVTLLWSGGALDKVATLLEENAQTARKHGEDWYVSSQTMLGCAVGLLAGSDLPRHPDTSEPADVDQFVQDAKKNADKSFLGMYHVAITMAGVHLGDHETALKHALEAEAYADALVGSMFMVAHCFYQSLALLSAARRDAGAPRRYLRKVRANQKKLKRWSEACPENFSGKYLLIEAELARSRGRWREAVGLYEQSLAVAQESQFPAEEALANELMAELFVEGGQKKAEATYRFEAYYAYLRWGAAAKVGLMEAQHPELAQWAERSEPGLAAEPHRQTHPGGTTDRMGEQLDLETIMKSSQAISGELVLESLLRKMMDFVVENAGAQRGCFLMARNGQWRVEAERLVEGGEEQFTPFPLTPDDGSEPRLAVDIVHYVANTLKPAVLDDASKAQDFAGDAYIRAVKPKSVLCVPLLYRGRLSGIIYLENNGASHVFTAARVGIVQMLSSQIAISLENALLFRNKEELIRAYERFVPREFLGFLGKESIVEVELGDQVEKEMSILFTDIRSFTALSEKMTPRENFAFINSFLSVMEPVISRHSGFIDKYIGDAIMALFPTNADDAVEGAIRMCRKLADFNRDRAEMQNEPIRIGIGVNSGRLMLGTVGGRNRMDGTVISDSVNLAARMEEMTKVFGSSILVSEHTFSRLEDPSRFGIRAVGRVRVKGKSEPVTVYEVFDGESVDSKRLKSETIPLFRKGLDLYRDRAFGEAEIMFKAICHDNPDDVAARVYVNRCRQYVERGVPDDWESIEDFARA